ncbi:hypothetical protein Taro_008844, partial [Colocasia esculenta]|nr:hypothetical protein [Colocasia esculenta]
MSVLELAAQQADLELRGKRALVVGLGRRGQLGVLPGIGQPVLFLTASLLAAPELLGEVRRETVLRPDYDGYCVYFVSYLALTRREGQDSGETSQQRQGALRAEETG